MAEAASTYTYAAATSTSEYAESEPGLGEEVEKCSLMGGSFAIFVQVQQRALHQRVARGP